MALITAPRPSRIPVDIATATVASNTASAARHDAYCRLREAQLSTMQRAFAPTGGLVSGDDVARRMRDHGEQPISRLARWIVARQVLSLAWHGQLLVPQFQWDLRRMQPWAGVTDVFAELAPVFDDWELAWWFSQPNDWLRGAAPCDRVAIDPGAVFQSARADRFVALG